MHRWALDGVTLASLVNTREWHGLAGEDDKFKLIAGQSPSPSENLYLFSDGALTALSWHESPCSLC